MQTINYNNSNAVFNYYDCIAEMSNIQVPSHNMDKYLNSCVNESKHSDIKSWLGCSGFAEVKRIVELEGWNEGVEKGKMLMDKIVVPKLPSVRRKKIWGQTGTSINMSKLYSGSSDKCWQTTKREITKDRKAKRGSINILIDLSVNCTMTSEQFFWKGALGTILAQALTKSGRNVRVLGAFSVNNWTNNGRDFEGYKNCTSVLNIKDFGQPVELNTMFAITALAGTARYYFFKAMLATSAKVNSHLGSPSPLNTSYFEPILDGNPTILIEDVWSETTALRRAEKIIDEL